VVGDVGWLTREELDSVAPGKNYGWPCYEGTVRTAGYSSDSRCKAEYAKEKTAARSVPPIYDYEHVQGQSAVVAGPVYAGTQYPSAYRGMLLFGDYAQGWIKRVALGPGDRPAGTPQVFIRDWYGVALEIGPGGDLAYISFGDGSPGTGSVARVAYSPDNATPVARASASPTWGGVPLRVQFSGNGSSDADGDSLSYSWDFGDGDHSSTPKPVHTYGARGDYVARLTVGDGRGRSDTAHVRISAANSPPTVRIASPTDGALYRDGGRVSLQGSATDPDDGPLPDSALAWYVLLRHVEHTHPLLAVTGGSHVFDTLRDHDADSFYEITLVATDSRGLASSRTVKVRPKTAWVTLASSPAGAPVSFGGISAKAPFEHLGAVGYHTSVSAAERFKVGGREYEFSRWSDGGAILHAIEIPDAPLKLVAIYRDITPPAPVTPAPDEPSSGDESGPLIEFSQPAGGIIRVLRGTARDRSGVRRVWVALRRKGSLVSRSGVRVCRWWSRSRRRLVMRRCPRAVWLRARLRRVGKRKVMWRVKLGRALPPGRFHAYFRAVDTHGNVGRGLVAGAKRHPEAPQR